VNVMNFVVHEMLSFSRIYVFVILLAAMSTIKYDG
jgi:hypothetical protein